MGSIKVNCNTERNTQRLANKILIFFKKNVYETLGASLTSSWMLSASCGITPSIVNPKVAVIIENIKKGISIPPKL